MEIVSAGEAREATPTLRLATLVGVVVVRSRVTQEQGFTRERVETRELPLDKGSRNPAPV
jgi:hypothetical protein